MAHRFPEATEYGVAAVASPAVSDTPADITAFVKSKYANMTHASFVYVCVRLHDSNASSV